MKKYALILSTLLLSACASHGPIRGTSAADATLQKDTYVLFSAIASAQMECDTIDYAQVLESRVEGHSAFEVWQAQGCGKTAAFDVDFVPSPMGGYTFSISPQKIASPPLSYVYRQRSYVY